MSTTTTARRRSGATLVTDDRHSGTVKWFNSEKGYGFIAPSGRIDGLDRDLFFHISALPRGMSAVSNDQVVTFQIERGDRDRRLSAANIQIER